MLVARRVTRNRPSLELWNEKTLSILRNLSRTSDLSPVKKIGFERANSGNHWVVNDQVEWRARIVVEKKNRMVMEHQIATDLNQESSRSIFVRCSVYYTSYRLWKPKASVNTIAVCTKEDSRKTGFQFVFQIRSTNRTGTSSRGALRKRVEKPRVKQKFGALFGCLKEKGASDEAHFWLNGYVNKQNCRIWSEANPQVYVETPLHPEKLSVWCALWAGGIIGPYFFKNDEGHNVTVNGVIGIEP
ncbi:hypothetical protein TNCV_1419081 [Trichonephila clavipes]|nr:hypothetical protein TNCV_1419081 [Trichonephila clavipes]